jgi:hypothetical protein
MLVNEYRLEIQFKKVGKVQNINNFPMISSLYVCMAWHGGKIYNSFVCGKTPRKFITAKLLIRKPGSSSVIESFAVINLRGVSTNKTIITFQWSGPNH